MARNIPARVDRSRGENAGGPLALVDARCARSGRAAKRLDDLVDLAESRPEQTRRSGGSLDPLRDLAQHRRGQVRGRRRCATAPIARAGCGARARSRRRSRRRWRRRPRAPRISCRSAHRAEAELRRGDREHARAGAPVGERPRLWPSSASSSSSSRHRRVVGARRCRRRGPDRSRPRLLPSRRGCSSPSPTTGGRSACRRSTIGPWKSRQRSAQSSGISVGLDFDEPVAGRGLEVAELRQLAGAAVDRVLDVALALLLLDAARGQQHSSASTRSAGSGAQRTARRITRRRGGRGRRCPRRRRAPGSPR